MTVELRDNPLKGLEIGPKLAACNDRERIFAYAYATGIAETAAAAARLAGYSDPGPHSNSLRSRAHQTLHKPHVMEAIEEIARKEFRAMIPHVISAARKIVQDPKHPDQAKLVSSLLSRLGYGEKASVDVNVSGEVVLNHTDAAVEDLRRLKAIGVPREKLIEFFGFSGLDMYEQMLAERDARVPKVIEHRPDELPAGGIDQHHNPMGGP